jgi:hypothetical protein
MLESLLDAAKISRIVEFRLAKAPLNAVIIDQIKTTICIAHRFASPALWLRAFVSHAQE